MRELRNVIEHAAIVARGQPIRPAHIPAAKAVEQPEQPSIPDGIPGQLAAWTRRTLREQALSGDVTLYEQFLQLAEPPVLRALLEENGWTALPPLVCSVFTRDLAPKSCAGDGID